MNRFLLDTHVWIWAQRRNTDQLSAAALTQIEDWQRESVAHLSPVSAWEIGLLVQAHNLDLGISV